MYSLMKSFASDERGALTPFILVLFIGIILLTGIGLDLARYEAERADLQDALDRGVLAAASLTQAQDAEQTVQEYLDTRALGQGNDVVPTVVPDTQANYRRIGATAAHEMNTTFLRLVGINDLNVAAGSAAEEGREDVEVSLVVDISGSMARERSNGTTLSRLQVLRSAAAEFTDLILTEQTVDTTTMSLVPYAGQVNPGSVMFDQINTGRVHNFSSCVEFSDGDFELTSLPGQNSRAQVPHFQWFRFEGDHGHEAEWGWCPSDAQAIVPLSNNPVFLKQRINALMGHDGTGTNNGMKWGLGLLDSTSNTMVTQLIGAGKVDESFADRPIPFNTEGSLKVIVLMTDGNTRYQQRPKNTSYNSQGEIDFWASNTLRSSHSILDTTSKRNSNEAEQINLLQNLCTLAKENGVTVFTIGFDVSETSPAYSQMRDCASSVSHFYHVEGIQLSTAFRLIAATITKLKLVE